MTLPPQPQDQPKAARRLRGGLLRRDTLPITALMALLLAAVGALTLGDAWRRSLDHVRALQAEQARGAADRIEQSIASIEHQLDWPGLAGTSPGGDVIESRRIEYQKLLHQVPAITEAAWIDAQGREQLRVSRLAMDRLREGRDHSGEPLFIEAAAGRVWHSAVSFRQQTEPSITIAQRAGEGGGVITVEVSLKFVRDVVEQIRPGGDGIAFVVDASGTLLAHPDNGLELGQTSLAALPQVAAALADVGAAPGTPAAMAVRSRVGSDDARDLAGQPVISAWATLEPLGWRVFVESSRAQALAPVWRNVQRVALLLGLGLLAAAAASAALARRRVQPIRALRDGVRRIAEGALDHRIDARGSDELEALAGDFNRMAGKLQASTSGLEAKVQERTEALETALAHQAASTGVLQVITRSVSDAQPVYDAILAACQELFEAFHIGITLIDDDGIVHLAAHGGDVPNRAAFEAIYPAPADEKSVTAIVCAERRLLHFGDVAHDEGVPPRLRAGWAMTGSRSVLWAPLMWQDRGIGSVFVGRRAVGRFSDGEVELIKTFADQVVIAIQNARLFRETQEALAQQTATANVLRVISSSVADEQPVYDAIVAACTQLFEAFHIGIMLIGDDGLVHLAAHGGEVPDRAAFEAAFPFAADADSATVTACTQRRVLHFGDVEHDEDVLPRVRSACALTSSRSILIAPLLLQEGGIGAIFVARRAAGRFSDAEVELMKTFADQAVIAIQNARLFRETQEALAQQTATANVLRVISSSVADEQPVFDKILSSTCELFASDEAAIFLAPGDGLLHRVAATGRWAASALPAFPRPVRGTSAEVVIAQRRQIHYPDVTDPQADLPPSLREAGQVFGNFAVVLTPLMEQGEAIGVVSVARPPGATFSDNELAQLRTFADQAVIAIRNTRLVRALEAQSQQLEVASRHKSEFLANMSHELRTPLNAVIGFSEVLIEKMFGEVNDKQLEYLRDIHSSGQHLLTLINDVLDLSKIEAGRMELELAPFDLAELLEHSLTLVRERALRQGLALRLEVAPEACIWVADQRKVKQVLLNLLSNAVKFTPAGGRVTLSARCVDDGRAIEVAVSDTGVGIAAEQQALVFEAFRQAKGDYLRKAEGTGLGLALARRFVELHGGTIRVASRPGAGSTFTFTLPRREDPSQEPGAHAAEGVRTAGRRPEVA